MCRGMAEEHEDQEEALGGDNAVRDGEWDDDEDEIDHQNTEVAGSDLRPRADTTAEQDVLNFLEPKSKSVDTVDTPVKKVSDVKKASYLKQLMDYVSSAGSRHQEKKRTGARTRPCVVVQDNLSSQCHPLYRFIMLFYM